MKEVRLQAYERRLLELYASGRHLGPSSQQSFPVIEQREKLISRGLITIKGSIGTGRVEVTEAGYTYLRQNPAGNETVEVLTP